MNIKQLVSEIAKREGKKSQVSVGNVREILGILADIAYVDLDVYEAIGKLGKSRAKRKKKK